MLLQWRTDFWRYQNFRLFLTRFSEKKPNGQNCYNLNFLTLKNSLDFDSFKEKQVLITSILGEKKNLENWEFSVKSK